jgi:hypothetical protein
MRRLRDEVKRRERELRAAERRKIKRREARARAIFGEGTLGHTLYKGYKLARGKEPRQAERAAISSGAAARATRATGRGAKRAAALSLRGGRAAHGWWKKGRKPEQLTGGRVARIAQTALGIGVMAGAAVLVVGLYTIAPPLGLAIGLATAQATRAFSLCRIGQASAMCARNGAWVLGEMYREVLGLESRPMPGEKTSAPRRYARQKVGRRAYTRNDGVQVRAGSTTVTKRVR